MHLQVYRQKHKCHLKFPYMPKMVPDVGSGVSSMLCTLTYSRQFKRSLYKYHCSETTVTVQDTTIFFFCAVTVKVTIV